MHVILAAVLAMSAVGDKGKPPADFLTTKSKAWNAWLAEPIHTSWIRIRLSDVLAGGFGPAEFVVADETVAAKPVTFDADGASRREALWRLSKKYGLDLKWSRTDEPTSFLGLPETHSRRDGPAGVTTMTQVSLTDYTTYEKLKKSKDFHKERRIDGVVFFSITTTRDIPFKNASAWVFVIERFKAKIPKQGRK